MIFPLPSEKNLKQMLWFPLALPAHPANTFNMLSKKVFLFCLLLVCIVRTSKAVKSIEIQLIRIEDIPTEEFKQASEVQNIQVATAGPGLVGLYVPLFMVLPRYFSCPSKVDKDCFARIWFKMFNHKKNYEFWYYLLWNVITKYLLK